MTTNVTDTVYGAYGFGTFLADMDGQTFVGHPGDGLQYSSILLVWPSTRTAVAVLAPAPGKTVDHALPDCALSLHQQLLGG